MKNKIYSIYDRKSGLYSKIFDCPNDEFASREFYNVYSMPNLAYMKTDVELYSLGTVDYESGSIKAYRKPKFVCTVADANTVTNIDDEELENG